MTDTTPARRSTGALVALVAITGLLAAIVPLLLDSSPAAAAELERFGSCEDLRDFTARTLPDGTGSVEGDQGMVEEGADGPAAMADDGAARGAAQTTASQGEALDASASSDTGGGGDADVGSTNTQVAGVDELDRADVAPDGRALVALDRDWLAYERAVAQGDIAQDGIAREDIAVSEDGTRPAPAPEPVEPDPAVLVLTRADGSVVDRVDLQGWDPQITWDIERDVVWVVTAKDGPRRGSVSVERFRTSDGLEPDGAWSTTGWPVSGRRIDHRFVLIATDSAGGPDVMPFAAPDDSPAVPCDEVWHPTEPTDSASSTLVATFQADGEVAPAATAQIVGSAGTVYANLTAAYVTTTTGQPFTSVEGAAEPRTSVHRFDLDDLRLTGSGSVPGHPLNQFALDEHDGHLRVATTVWPFGVAIADDVVGIADGPIGDDGIADDGRAGDIARTEPAAPPAPDNLVTILDLDGDLDQVGQLRGLGKPGETIQGVRFDGPVGYVVTFQQTDPLYVIDLSDPRAPRAVGELEIPGFSSYLHPVGDGLVAAVGSAGNAEGLTGGSWVQLFDVSDPTAPRLVSTDELGGYSEAQNDHHAFAYFGGGRFAVPFEHFGDVVIDRPLPVDTEPGVEPVRLLPRTVRLFATSGGTLERGVDLDVEVSPFAAAFTRTAELAEGDLLVITGDGTLRRFAPDGRLVGQTPLR